MPIPDSNIQATAAALLRGRGAARALAFVEAQGGACTSRNDVTGEAVWRRIGETIRQMQSDENGPSRQDPASRDGLSWLSRALRARRADRPGVG